MSFIRLGDLTDKLVGKAARGKRPFVRWPEELVDYTKFVNQLNASGVVFILPFAVMAVVLAMLISGLEIHSFFWLALLSALAGACMMSPFIADEMMQNAYYDVDIEQSKRTGEIMKPLLGKDPYLTLSVAAFLTVGAMPEWLRKRMIHGTWRDWPNAHRAKPYTVERAGLDYLELMNEIEHDPKKYMWYFHGELFPGACYRLPDSLKASVSEIILLLSSLPDSGEEPDEETMEAVMDTIDRLATIDGESFTTAVARSTLAVRNDERRKRIQRGRDRLSKINKECERAAVSADVQRVEAISITRSITR